MSRPEVIYQVKCRECGFLPGVHYSELSAKARRDDHIKATRHPTWTVKNVLKTEGAKC